MSRAPNFDLLARPYRWLEYASFGPLLHRTRTFFLPQLSRSRSALVLGDGDGRFTYDLLRTNPHIHVHAVDLSEAMLSELRRRCYLFADRLQTTQCNAMDMETLNLSGFDLIVTHFFLDCFSQSQIDSLIPILASLLPPQGQWLISDFAIPAGTARLPGKLLVGSLYAAFRILTGLSADKLPDHHTPLQREGLHLDQHHPSLGGILISELWCKRTLL